MKIEPIEVLRSIINFTYDDYTLFLKFLKEKYNITPFQDYTDTQIPKLILRHDIDFSLIPALRIAKIENRLGIRSTYFVLFSGVYNLFEKSNLKTLRRILDLGHEIGLHYDISQYQNYNSPFEEVLLHQIKTLEKLVKKPVTSISKHNVSLDSRDPFRGSENPLNCYNDEVFKNTHYVSDSCRAWNLKHIQLLLTESPPKVQLLIHPILWTNKKCNRYKLLDLFFKKLENKNADYKEYCKSVWKSTPKVQMYDKEITNFLNEKEK